MRELKVRFWNGEEFIYLDYSKDDIYRCGSFEEMYLYTGLKDKEGVEIYEGDLIKNGRGRTGKVKWHDALALFDCVFVSDDGSQNPAVDKSHGFKSNLWEFHVKVIGNIHQNPELLS